MFSLESAIAGDGCFHSYQTLQSSTTWLNGVWNRNEFGIRHSSNGLWISDTGNTTISGNSDVGPAQAQTSIKAYANHAGHQGNVEIEAMWNTQGFINFNTAASDGLLFTATKDALYMYCGTNNVYFYNPTTNASDDRLEENEIIIEHACETLSKLRPQFFTTRNQIWKIMTLQLGIKKVF